MVVKYKLPDLPYTYTSYRTKFDGQDVIASQDVNDPGLLVVTFDNDGMRCWFLNGYRHRLDGPAIEYPNGEKQWYQHGMLHREDGPAIITANGDREWFIRNKEFTPDIMDWLIQNEYPSPKYCEWSSIQKTLFKLRWT